MYGRTISGQIPGSLGGDFSGRGIALRLQVVSPVLPSLIEVQTEIYRQSVLALYSFAFESIFLDTMFAERMPVRKVTPVSFFVSNIEKVWKMLC